MVLKDLLRTLNAKDFLRIGELQEDEITKAEGITAEQIAGFFCEFCQRVSNLSVKPTDAVILAFPLYEDGERSVDAAYYHKEDLAEKLPAVSKMEIAAYSKTDSQERLSDILQKTSKLMPTVYGFEFTPWEEVLGATVISENYEHVGHIEFAASILGEMTFNGFSRESQDERREELEKAAAEAEELAKLPPEERKSHYISAEEVFAEFGIEKDENWEEDKRLMLLDCVKTRDERIKELKRIAPVVLSEIG